MDAQKRDPDPQETQEWIDALHAVLAVEGPDRAHELIERLIETARQRGAYLPFSANTAYINTIPTDAQVRLPGDPEIEHRIRSYVRWNAMAMVLRANKHTNVGGHIASFASAADALRRRLQPLLARYDRRARRRSRVLPGPLGDRRVCARVHAGPFHRGAARQLPAGGRRTRRLVVPAPVAHADFWQFPTVSMGLGPLMAIYQARFMKYLQDRGLAQTEGRKVWAFMGDGEMDEPESMGAIGMASRENLENLIFVVNCNLQRLDGPVRGNGKIIQELESEFRGAGWNVIKVIWGTHWDALLARDKKGILMKRMMEAVDGEYQTFKSKDGAYVREYFFNTPELKALVADWSDDEIWHLNRGGHDPYKIYAAYHAAVNHKGQPTVILAKTIKGYGMGTSGEAQNITHQQKKMSHESLARFRDRFDIPVPDDKLDEIPYVNFPPGSPELEYMRERRMELGGYVPQRRRRATTALAVPELPAFERFLKSTEDREISTTMAFVQILQVVIRDKDIGKHVVPIVPDESRTFGMEGMFRQLGIWNQQGQLYTPQDHDQLMFYKEDKHGQILQEGINEAGGMCDWIAAATSYSTHDVPMIPFYIFYSMFGFQRVGDLCWAAGDMRSRGFLLGGTAGRTTLNGEGLQHEDGHSHLISATVPNCISYDPTFAYEVAVIIQDGLRRMCAEQQDVYYYITLMNENYTHPAMPAGAAPDILKGMYKLQEGATTKGPRVQLMGSGVILRQVMAAAELLKSDFGVESDIWSCPSFTELARDGNAVMRWNTLHPTQPPRRSHVQTCLDNAVGPAIAATDYMRLFAEQIRPLVKRRYVVLGTDGFGRSDTREELRQLLRGQSALRRRGRVEGARGRRDDSGGEGCGGHRQVRHRPGQARALDCLSR